MNTQNLDYLISYLESLPTNYDKFSMTDWCWSIHEGQMSLRDVIGPWSCSEGNNAPCGTSMCVAGHMPFVPEFDYIIDKIIHSKNLPWTTWDDLAAQILEIEEYCIKFKFIFDYTWYDYDNTLSGAIERLKYCRDHIFPDINVDEFDSVKQYWMDKTGPFLVKE